jgi:hypothetical protein
VVQEPYWGLRRLVEATVSLRRTTLYRNPLDEGSARAWDFHLTTHNTHKKHTFMSPGGVRTRKPKKRVAAAIGIL